MFRSLSTAVSRFIDSVAGLNSTGESYLKTTSGESPYKWAVNVAVAITIYDTSLFISIFLK